MLLSKTVTMRWNPSNIKWYESKGYIYTKWNDEFEVIIEDLTDGSHALIDVKCDCKDCISPIVNPIKYQDYLRCVHDDGKYYCQKCSVKLFGNKIKRKMNLNKSISFAQWCIDNVDNNFLEKYWDWDKNNEIDINPWEISYGSKTKEIFIRCQEKDYHGSYPIVPKIFTLLKCRCPYCGNHKVHILDSLGTLYPQVLNIWSNRNEKSSYEYTSMSDKEVWWKCLEGEHEDYYRNISGSNSHGFRCPECQYSKGEKRIEEYLLLNNWIKIEEKIFNELNENDKYYIPQKTYDKLIGLGNGLLSYDFYLPQYNLLLEYQGEFHDGTAYQQSKEKFLKQQEHDKRKREYANKNNIRLLEIWYWDYENIDKILDKELK